MSDIKKTWKEDWKEAKSKLHSHQKPSDYLTKSIKDVERKISFKQVTKTILDEREGYNYTDVSLDNLKTVLVEMKKSLRYELKKEAKQLSKNKKLDIDLK